MTDLNDLFPQPDPPEENDSTEPEFGENEINDIVDFLEGMSLDDTIDEIETELRDVANKFLFELLVTLLRPDPESKQKIVHGLVNMAASRVESTMSARAEELSKEEIVEMSDHVNKAFRVAEKRFREDYENSFFDDEFMERCRKAIRKNLSR